MSQRPKLALSTLLLLLSACSSGGDGGGGSDITGQFVDSAVDGLNYSAGDVSGITDNLGRFTVPAGSQVTFSIGGIELGTAPAAEFITPVTLISGADDENHPTVQNIARLLQSLDSNSDPLDGIEIPSTVRAAAALLSVDVAASVAAFETNTDLALLLQAAGVADLVSAADASNHLSIALTASYAGLYEGNFSGTDSGSFAVVVDRYGEILGAAVASSEPTEIIGVSGSVDSDGTGVFGNATSGATFDGTVSSSTLSGNWVNTFISEGGTYSGGLTGSPDAFVSNLFPFIRAYAGTFEFDGTSTTFSANVDARAHISLSLGDGSEAVALIESVDGSSAQITGISDEGTVIDGTINSNSGVISGTLRNDFTGDSGTFSGNVL